VACGARAVAVGARVAVGAAGGLFFLFYKNLFAES
jgi:hypothetical protein